MVPSETVILVAEDDPVIRNLVRLMLSKEGYSVLTAGDGMEAVEVCKGFADQIHLLLTDVRMPRMDGWTLAEEIRKIQPEVKVVVMTGYTTETIRRENRPDAFLRKPFVPPTLLRCVQRVLASPGPVECEQ
jgi:CheY-like chemotaxis protein